MLAGQDGLGAGFAADRDEAALVQRVYRQAERPDGVPDVLRAGVGQWIELHQRGTALAPEGRVELHHRHVAAGRALVAALAGDPGLESRELARERRDLAHAAALLVAVLIEAEQALGPHQALDRGGIGKAVLDAQFEVVLYRLEVAVRLRMQPPGVEAEHAERQAALTRVLDQSHVFSATEADGHISTEVSQGTAHDRRRIG